jgi:hypothetical protein
MRSEKTCASVSEPFAVLDSLSPSGERVNPFGVSSTSPSNFAALRVYERCRFERRVLFRIASVECAPREHESTTARMLRSVACGVATAFSMLGLGVTSLINNSHHTRRFRDVRPCWAAHSNKRERHLACGSRVLLPAVLASNGVLGHSGPFEAANSAASKRHVSCRLTPIGHVQSQSASRFL